MSFTAKDVQALRQASGAGMMDAKRALEANDGDAEAAAGSVGRRARTSPGATRPGRRCGLARGRGLGLGHPRGSAWLGAWTARAGGTAIGRLPLVSAATDAAPGGLRRGRLRRRPVRPRRPGRRRWRPPRPAARPRRPRPAPSSRHLTVVVLAERPPAATRRRARPGRRRPGGGRRPARAAKAASSSGELTAAAGAATACGLRLLAMKRPSSTASAMTRHISVLARMASSLPGIEVLDDVGVAVGVDDGDDRDAELVGLGDGDVLLLGVEHEHRVGTAAHVADAAEVALQLLELAAEEQRFLLGHRVELAGGPHALVLLHLGDALGDGLEVGEHAAEPALVDVRHAALLGVAADGSWACFLVPMNRTVPPSADRSRTKL